MVAAIPPKATSNNRGTIPKIVVVAAIKTGRVLETVASMIEVYKSTPLRCWFYFLDENTVEYVSKKREPVVYIINETENGI